MLDDEIEDEKPSARLRFGYFLVDLLMFAFAMQRRFRDDASALGRIGVVIFGGLVLAIGALQRARRAWRAAWWATAGTVNWRWRCELCQGRGRRVTSAFCRSCWDGGLAG